MWKKPNYTLWMENFNTYIKYLIFFFKEYWSAYTDSLMFQHNFIFSCRFFFLLFFLSLEKHIILEMVYLQTFWSSSFGITYKLFSSVQLPFQEVNMQPLHQGLSFCFGNEYKKSKSLMSTFTD